MVLCVFDFVVGFWYELVCYDVKYVVDDKLEMVWWCNGLGEGQQIIFILFYFFWIVGVGMINGYVKVFGNVDFYL